MQRQIVLDTETTGLSIADGHRIIEIGCLELIDRKITGNNFHFYIQPDREVDVGAISVHGINNEFLVGKPRFNEIASSLLDYLKEAELIIHNAPFDVGFLNAEFSRCYHTWRDLTKYCQVIDTLVMARKMHPGQKNTLDALCKRYDVSNAHRKLHGALLDAEILAEVYLAMTGGQFSLNLDLEEQNNNLATSISSGFEVVKSEVLPTAIIYANTEEIASHKKWLDKLTKINDADSLWEKLENN